MIDLDIYAVLSTSSAITNLVSTRIKPDSPTIDMEIPCIVYRITGGNDPAKPLNGVSGLMQHNVQIEVFSLNYQEGTAISKAVKDTLDGYRFGRIRGAVMTEISGEEQENGYHVSQTYQVFWNNSAA